MERDERIYRAYLGSINSSMKRWGLLGLAVYAVAFLLLSDRPGPHGHKSSLWPGTGSKQACRRFRCRRG